MVHMGKSNRPERLSQGHYLSIHYKIEGLVRLAEGRMFYLASNDRPDRPNTFCWECAHENSPTSSPTCVKCGENLHGHKFLISTRWLSHSFEGFEAFFQKDLRHPALHYTLDYFFEKNCLYSVVQWKNQDFMLNKAAPLQAEQVLRIAQRMLGLLGFFHTNGVTLEEVHPRNFLYDPEKDDFVFFEPDIRRVYNGPVPEIERGFEIPSLAQSLLYLTSVSDHDLRTLLRNAVEGHYPDAYHFGRALEKFMTRGIAPTKMIDNIAALSDVGLIRNLNEDNWNWTKITNDCALFVVADGMGGHDCGEIASQMAVEHICEEAVKRYQEAIANRPELGLDQLEELLQSSFQAANNSIKQYSETVGSDMGTTMVCSLVFSQQGQKYALVANVGDSRGYLYRGGTLHQITKDHSLVAKMVEQKQLTKEEARVHPHSNILLRTVGTDRNVSIDVFRVGLQENDVILLCSDGLWGEVEDEKLEHLVGADPNLQLVCRSLLRASHLGGGRDNCTIMMVRA